METKEILSSLPSINKQFSSVQNSLKKNERICFSKVSKSYEGRLFKGIAEYYANCIKQSEVPNVNKRNRENQQTEESRNKPMNLRNLIRSYLPAVRSTNQSILKTQEEQNKGKIRESSQEIKQSKLYCPTQIQMNEQLYTLKDRTENQEYSQNVELQQTRKLIVKKKVLIKKRKEHKNFKDECQTKLHSPKRFKQRPTKESIFLKRKECVKSESKHKLMEGRMKQILDFQFQCDKSMTLLSSRLDNISGSRTDESLIEYKRRRSNRRNVTFIMPE